MTNYNEKLDEILRQYAKRVENIPSGKTYGWSNEKQLIISLIKELVTEAKPLAASKEVIETYLQNGMTQKAAEYHGRNHAIKEFEQNLLKELEEL